MAIKGHARIKLTNVHTGEVETYEEDNLVTDAVADMYNAIYKVAASFSPFGYQHNIPAYNDITDFFGGIVLFNDTLDEDSAKYYQHCKNGKVVGYANQNQKTTTDPKKGTIVTEKSGKTSNGYKFVWSFDTSSGNGTIASLGLVPNVCGDCGTAGYNESTNVFTKVLQLTSGGETVSSPPVLTISNERLYALKADGNIIHVYKLWKLGQRPVINPGDLELSKFEIAQYEVTGTLDNCRFVSNFEERVLIIYKGDNSQGNLLELKESKITSIVSIENFPVINAALDRDGYLYGVKINSSGNYTFMRANIQTGISEVLYNTGFITYTNYEPYCIASPEGFIVLCTVGDKACRKVVDGELQEYGINYFFMEGNTVKVPGTPLYVVTNKSDIIAAIPTFLSTINNLSSPVKKTADKTMEITYTLTYE